MDAQRQQVFVAQFAVANDAPPCPVLGTQIMDNEVWLERLVAGDSVSGIGLAKLVKRLPSGVQVIAEQAWAPRAVTLGRLALAKYRRGERSDYWKLLPQYFRQSAAEEKFDQGLIK